MAALVLGKVDGLLQPAQQFAVYVLLPGEEDVVGPAAGVGLHFYHDPGGVQGPAKADGEHKAVLRPALSPADGQGDGGKQPGAVETHLTFLHLHAAARTQGGQAPEQGLVQR